MRSPWAIENDPRIGNTWELIEEQIAENRALYPPPVIFRCAWCRDEYERKPKRNRLGLPFCSDHCMRAWRKADRELWPAC